MAITGLLQSRSISNQEKRNPVHAELVNRRAGRAGVIASILMAMVGVIIGAGASYIIGKGNTVSARYSGFDRVQRFELEDNKPLEKIINSKSHDNKSVRSLSWSSTAPTNHWRGLLREGIDRQSIVDRVIEQKDTSETYDTELYEDAPASFKPRVAIIFDDIGPDQDAFYRIVNMPGPVTLSFLPYTRNIQALVDEASKRGNAIMLHLPMEPLGAQNPGPHALKVEATASAFRKDLQWNLERFSGYRGVNNHMGSRLTADKKSMHRVMAAMKKRGLYFVDSVTTAKTVAREAADDLGVTLLSRDVFLDPEEGVETVRKQLYQVEEIARRTGYAIAIAHPHIDTLDMLGPWLASASLRGFELVTVDSLINNDRALAVKG